MKKIMILSVFSLLASGVASAYDAVSCFDDAAYRALTADQKIKLCSGATSSDPIRCYDNAAQRGLTTDQRIELCKASH